MLLFLSFHQVEEAPEDPVYSVGRDRFRRYLDVVSGSGVPVVDPGNLPADWPRQRRGTVLAFDDATSDHFTLVAAELALAGFPALFYVPTAKLGQEGYLDREQVHRLSAMGHTIASHAHTHQRLDAMTETEMAWELEQSRDILADILGSPPVHFAPPGGFYTQAVREAARRLGYRFFRTSLWGYNRTLDVWRIEILPITGAISDGVLQRALRGQGELSLKLAYLAKNAVRRVVPSALYSNLRRSTLARRLR